MQLVGDLSRKRAHSVAIRDEDDEDAVVAKAFRRVMDTMPSAEECRGAARQRNVVKKEAIAFLDRVSQLLQQGITRVLIPTGPYLVTDPATSAAYVCNALQSRGYTATYAAGNIAISL